MLWTVVLEKTLESPLDCKEIQPVHPKGDQFWIFIGRTDGEAETPMLWPPDAKDWLIGKDPDAGKDWRQEEKGMTEDEMVGWHHCLSGHEFEQAPGVGDGQRPGVLQSMRSERVGHDKATQLNWTEKFHCCVYKERRVWKGRGLLRARAMGSGLLGQEYFSTDVNLPAHGSSKQQASFQSASLSFKNSLLLEHPFLLVSGRTSC